MNSLGKVLGEKNVVMFQRIKHHKQAYSGPKVHESFQIGFSLARILHSFAAGCEERQRGEVAEMAADWIPVQNTQLVGSAKM